MATGDRTWNKTVGGKRVQSQYTPRLSHTQKPNLTFDDDYEDDDLEKDDIATYRSYSSRVHARPVENVRPFVPSACLNGVESPSLKRKRDAAAILESMANRMEDMFEYMGRLEQNVDTLSRKCNTMADELTNVRKSQDKVQKLTVRIAHTRLDTSSDEPPTTLAPITVDGKTFSITPLPGGGPTKLMCKLIRDMYSVKEINEGIPHDHRLAAIKEAVRSAYYANDPETFDVFWKTDAHKSIGNQKRAQTYRSKQKPGVGPVHPGNDDSNDEQENE